MNWIMEHPQFLVIAWLLLVSAVLFVVMGRDKHLAIQHKRRVSEAALFLLALAGGALGGVLGMQVFHHKTKHWSFLLGFPILALLQWGLTIVLMLPE